jgi:hypothetical protein
MGRGVVEFCVDGEVGGGKRSVGKMRDRHGRTDGDGATDDEIDFAPEAHVLVRRAWIPIDPVDAEILLGRGEGFDREYIFCAGLEEVRYVEVIGAICAGDSGGVGDATAVNPNLAAVVDAAEVDTGAQIAGCGGGSYELNAIPPAAAVGAVLRHGQI